MTDAIVVLCTCPDQTSADLISELLLKQQLAACITQLPGVTSIYRWQGKVERATEIQLIIKSRQPHFATLQDCIVAHHPYDVPELLALPVNTGLPAYLDWLREETP